MDLSATVELTQVQMLFTIVLTAATTPLRNQWTLLSVHANPMENGMVQYLIVIAVSVQIFVT